MCSTQHTPSTTYELPRLSTLSTDELCHPKARGEAVELKLKVLDDKLIRAQVSEEEKLKPLHDNVAALTENLYAERLAREVVPYSLCL